MKNIDRDSFDVTEAIATWSIKELIKLLQLLDAPDNGFTNLYFDGCNAQIFAIRDDK